MTVTSAVEVMRLPKSRKTSHSYIILTSGVEEMSLATFRLGYT